MSADCNSMRPVCNSDILPGGTNTVSSHADTVPCSGHTLSHRADKVPTGRNAVSAGDHAVSDRDDSMPYWSDVLPH